MADAVPAVIAGAATGLDEEEEEEKDWRKPIGTSLCERRWAFRGGRPAEAGRALSAEEASEVAPANAGGLSGGGKESREKKAGGWEREREWKATEAEEMGDGGRTAAAAEDGEGGGGIGGMPGRREASGPKLLGAKCRKKEALFGAFGGAAAEQEEVLAAEGLRRCIRSLRVAASASPIFLSLLPMSD